MQCWVGGGSTSVTILGSHAVLGGGREYVGHHIRKPCSVGWGEGVRRSPY